MPLLAAAAGSTSLPEAMEALLRSPNIRVRMRDVPPLSESDQAELIRRYALAEGITNKYCIARILAFGGGTQAVPLFLDALTREFNGRELTGGESAKLLHLPQLLGLLAAKDNRALEFLIQGSSPGFWNQFEVRTQRGGRERSEAWAGRCLEGLVMSGRPEGQAVIDQYRDDPALAARLKVDGAMVDAAFVSDLIREYGLTQAMDEHLSSLDKTMRQFNLWESTTNGIWWSRWRGQVESLRRNQAPQP